MVYIDRMNVSSLSIVPDIQDINKEKERKYQIPFFFSAKTKRESGCGILLNTLPKYQ